MKPKKKSERVIKCYFWLYPKDKELVLKLKKKYKISSQSGMVRLAVRKLADDVGVK